MLFQLRYPLLLMAGVVTLAVWKGLGFAEILLWIGLAVFAGGWVRQKWGVWCMQSFTDWLGRVRNEPDAPPPKSGGLPYDTVERVQRLLRKQRRETEELKSRLDNLQSALQASPNGVVILDNQEYIEWYNRTACKHFGLDYSNRDLSQRITYLLRAPALTKSLTAHDFGKAIVLESPLSTDIRPMRLEVWLLPYGQGRLLMLSRDVTTLEQAEAMQRDFIANISHEIRTPLTVLAGFIETLQNLPASAEERENYLERMAGQAARMESLVEDLLMLSRLEGSELPDTGERVAVKTLLARLKTDAAALSAHLVKQNAPGHELVFTGMETEMEIAGAASELYSAFFNLVNNAIRYTPPGSRIVVCWRVMPDGSACFSVQDNGPGIAPEHIPRLTERFYRINAEHSRASGGTGIGLSIVKHILKRHDATLAVE
ncbi:MAG: phosphate regulon sensor histidine kinase PhoR, partial [Zoogloeaceae bacterium]|nr:phosphate regulon sensor histidine kinase PhoR [Zoogloeaceae bacterium]